jgi:hypothetical protein
MVQVSAVPVQGEYIVYVPSFFLIKTVYPVIGELPSAGATQVIVKAVVLLGLRIIVAVGVEGLCKFQVIF